MKKRIISAILFTLVAIFAFIPAISLTAEAAEESVTLSFADKANRTSFSTTQQIWEENGIKLTNDKDSATSDVADYAAPARFYKGSTITIEYPGMTKIVLACSGSNYAKAPTGLTGATASTSGTTLTITLNEPVDSFSFNCNSSQLRVTSMTVYYEAASETPECTHTNTTTTTVDATCTTEGSVTVTCDDCEEILSTETLPTIDHTYVNGTCTACGETQALGTTTLNIVIADYADANNWVNATQYTTIEDNITITASGESDTGKYYSNGENWRLYQTENAKVTFAANGNYTIISVKVTYNVANTGVLQMNSENILSGTVIDVNATSITLSVGNTGTATNGQVRITEMEIVYKQSDCDHTYEESVTPPTCTDKGYTTYTCSKCSDSYTNNETPALGHTWDDGVITVEPGITTEGEKTYTCDVCKATKTEVLSAKGYTATFAVPGGITAPDKKSGLYIYLPELESTTYTDENEITYTFVGWSTEEFGDTTTPNFYNPNSKVDLTEDTVFYAVYSLTTGGNGGNGDYVLTDLSKILATDKVVIVFTHSNGTTYAVTNNNGTSKAPGGIVVTINGNALSATPDDTLIWNISNSSGDLTIYPDGDTSTWLYCTSTNNGVRVGTNTNKVFTLDSTTGYLKHTATSRYLGIYSTTPDLRCYTTHTTQNIANQTVAFYVQSSGGTTTYKTIGCLHENTEQEIIGNCGESGTKKITCNDCGYVTEESIAKIDHEYTVTEVIVPTCTSGGYTLNTCSRCGSTYRSDLTDASEHSFDANGSCTVCGALNAAVYDLSGKYYISTARADGNYWYMSSIINLASNGKTHRYSAVSSGLTTLPESITSPNLSRIFVLERINDGEDAGKYLIYAFGIVGEEKYVGYTVIDPENPENSATFVSRENALKLTIENVTAEKTFTFSFGEGDEKRSLALYSNPGSDFFAFYKSNSSQKKNLSLIPISFDGTDADEFTGASLNIGSDLSIRYHVVPNMETSLDCYSVRFTMNGKEVTVQGVAEDGKLVFSFKGISPQFMGSSIKAELFLDGEIIDTVESYSVKQYVIDAIALHSTDTYLCTLLSDVLYYGAAAQRYLNKNVAEEALVTYGVADLTPSEITTTDADKQRSIVTATGADTTLVKYTAAGVRFDYNNRIYVKFTTTDVANVTVTVSGVALEIIPLGNNTYVAYSEGISALEFDNAVSFKLYYGENLIQTLNYTVNTYAWDKNADSEIGDLALALYRYGKSTAAYEESKSINY